MGPRSADRGIDNGEDALVGAGVLQWGRDQLIAELMFQNPIVRTALKLQWGRDQLIAEFAGLAGESALRILRLQWGRDQLIAELNRIQSASSSRRRFNGAAIS